MPKERKNLAESGNGLGLIKLQKRNSKKKRTKNFNCLFHSLISHYDCLLPKLRERSRHAIIALEFSQRWFCTLWTEGCHHFIGWRYIRLTYILGEYVTCLQIFKWRKLAIDFHKNTMYWNSAWTFINHRRTKLCQGL